MSLNKILLLLALSSYISTAWAQDDLKAMMEDDTKEEKQAVSATFKTTKLVNMQTIEQVKKGELDFRIAHRFDDAGTANSASTAFGFDNVTDIRFSFDYGIKDWWAIGVARSKGATYHRQILDYNTKIKLLSQTTNNKVPVSVSIYGLGTYTPMKSSTDTNAVNYFNKGAHRMTYAAQILIARKFNSWFSLQLAPTFTHRNYVHYTDKNDVFGIGIGGRLKFTKRMGLIADYFMPIRRNNFIDGVKRYNSLGVGLEIETGGHVFHLLFSNNTSMLEPQYLTENNQTWTKGQFRFGFNISRVFNLH